ncbi:MAG: hypothetical protein JST16_06040 [Bdellovibrionales bacterium]|nr:hypothetical protein [Bdellovibrionales bacterium]
MRAVVDIGSNSVKFALADFQRGVPRILKKKSWVTRLGKDLAKTGLLDPESVAATDKALQEIARALSPYAAKLHTFAVATSAVRDCRNPEAVANRVQAHLGVPLRVLTGLEEARYSLMGSSAAAELHFSSKDCVCVDVGGASTEVGIVAPHFAAHSFQAGAVRCHEALGLDHMPVSDERWAQAARDMDQFFPNPAWSDLRAQIPATHRRAVAVGGSLLVAARTLGAMKVEDEYGNPMGYQTTRADFEDFNDRFRRMSLEERTREPHIEKGRADILCAGILCLTEVLRRLDIEELLVTDWGLRYGLLLAHQP